MSRTTSVPGLARGVLGSAVVAALVTGCTAKAPTIPTPVTSSSSTTATADYPIALQRLGGVAGFTDTVTIEGDRTVLARINNRQVGCTLDPAAFSALTAAALTVGDSGTNSTPTMEHPDDLLVLLNGVATTDGRLEDIEPVVTTLFDDLSKPEAQRTTCR